MRKFALLGLLFVSALVFGEEAAVVVSKGAAISSTVLDVVITILAPILGILGVAIASAIAKKYHLEMTAAMKSDLDHALEMGVLAAEAWAAKSKDSVTGDAKLDYALKVVRDIGHSATVKSFTQDQLKKFIEAKLQDTVNAETKPYATA